MRDAIEPTTPTLRQVVLDCILVALPDCALDHRDRRRGELTSLYTAA
jgi:hypothetical protein